MSEGSSSTRMKRYGALLFKNPPQPHMCIQVYLQDSEDVSYINVLSWDKVALPSSPSEPIPFYGGMKVSGSRNEKDCVSVYAVIAHSEVLRLNGKNAPDPKKRTTLIEDILDYVEATNEGVKFARVYSILKDRDITGELKKVWNAVQSRRDKENEVLQQQETWIDAQPQIPQYAQSYENQTLSSQQTNQQAQQKSSQSKKYTLQPPDYQPNENYQCNSKYDMLPIQCYSSNSNVQIYQDRYTAPNCPAYSATSQYQMQQQLPQVQYVNKFSNPESNYIAPTNSPAIQRQYNVEKYFLQLADQHYQMDNSSPGVYMIEPQQPVVEYDLRNQCDQRSVVNKQHPSKVHGTPCMGVIQKNNSASKSQAQSYNQDNSKKEIDNRVQLLQTVKNRNLQVTDLDDDEEPAKADSEVELGEYSKQDKKDSKSKIKIIKKNRHSKKDKVIKNGNGTTSAEIEMARLSINDKDEKKGENEVLSGKNGLLSKQKNSDSPKRTQTTVNNILKSVFKLPSSSSDENPGLFVRSNKKSNGQIKNETKTSEDEACPGYTILRKEGTSEDIKIEVPQVPVIPDATDIAPVLS